jgi:hypothetical protein
MPVVAKRKNRKMRGGANGGNGSKYTFTEDKEIYFFSDLEGNMPDGIKNLMFDEEENLLPLGNKVIVFTGDLIDRGECSIRNLQRMLRLKEANPENVILICGNRDANKIRMYPECHIQEMEDKIFKNKDITVDGIVDELNKIKDDDTSIFTNKLDAIKEIIDIKGINSPANVRPVFTEIYSDDISRITKMYSNTLGSPKQIEFFAKEFEVLFTGKSFGIEESFWGNKEKDKHKDREKYDTLLKFIAMMNMVMGKVWDDNVLPAILAPYNGLYIKYLQQCHIMASITIGTKLCIVSHAGIPYEETQGFYIPTEIGVVPSPNIISRDEKLYGVLITTRTSSTNNPHYYKISNIESLNNDFTTFIEGIKGGNVAYEEYKKYVAMSANCDDTVKPYTAYASPIVSQKELEEVKKKKDTSLDKFKTGNITKVYNIFGHQPSGLLPYISTGIHTYHIDLDISRAEDPNISNKKSYVYLKITEDKDLLFGKTDINNTYHHITDKDGDKGFELDTKNITVVKGGNIVIDYSNDGIPLESYCNNVLIATYTTHVQNKKDRAAFISTLFTVDNNKYYGMFSWTLVEYDKTGLYGGRGRGKTKVYTKSIKRFLYGKRKMVIYVGKRGGEYVKVKGEYVSLAKFRGKK